MHTSFPIGANAAAITVLAMSGAAHAATFFNLSGDISPADRSVTSVHVLASFPEDGDNGLALGAWQVSDAPIGLTTLIDFNSSAGFDTSGGLYAIAGVNEDGGVSITLPDSVFTEGSTPWTDLFSVDESTVKGWLESNDKAQLQNWFNNEVRVPGFATPFGTRATFVDFTDAETNGDGVVNFKIIPAPGALALAGIAGLGLSRRRR